MAKKKRKSCQLTSASGITTVLFVASCSDLKKVIVVRFVPTEVIRAHPSRAAKAVARSQPVLDA